MKISYLGHSCFLVDTGKGRLLFDPFIRPNELAQGKIDIDKVETDYILVSHGHDDHTADLMYLAEKCKAKVIGSWELCCRVEKNGYSNTHAMNFGGSFSFDFGRVKMFQAMHTSSFGDCTYAGAAGGFIVSTQDRCFYYSGDTGLFTDMKLIPEFHKLDFAFLPIGDNFTMDAEQAVVASDFIQCNRVVAMHFDTFGYIRVDHEHARRLFENRGKELIIAEIGESFNL